LEVEGDMCPLSTPSGSALDYNSTHLIRFFNPNLLILCSVFIKFVTTVSKIVNLTAMPAQRFAMGSLTIVIPAISTF
jgi:hypothetical protein